MSAESTMAERCAFLLVWEGRRFLALNAPEATPETFAAVDQAENGHAALLAFWWDGKVWTILLFHAAHRKDTDLLLIAKKFGGNGEKGACGFKTASIPFPLFAY